MAGSAGSLDGQWRGDGGGHFYQIGAITGGVIAHGLANAAGQIYKYLG
jgi:hypothetical protein